ncbi:MAG: hypothetical protein R6V47_07325 [Candidatus Delongbacteria bacterium]
MKSVLTILFLPYLVFGSIFEISNSPVGIKSSGMSNSDLAVIHRGSFLSNPAILGFQKGAYLNSSYYNYFSDIYLAGVCYSHPDLVFDNSSTGFSMFSIDYGNFEDIETGYQYRPYELMLALSQGYSLFGVSAGVSVKYVYSSITSDHTSTGLMTDITFLYEIIEHKAAFSSGLFNLGSQLTRYYHTAEDIIPFTRTGFSYKLDKLPLTLTLVHEYFFAELNKNNFMTGLELKAKENLTVRAGYDISGPDKQIGTNSKSEKFSGLSFGTTIFINEYEFDIAYILRGELENEFGMSVNFNISEFINNKKGGQ